MLQLISAFSIECDAHLFHIVRSLIMINFFDRAVRAGSESRERLGSYG